ncbi:hypothetical protein ACN26Y_16775 [Micromonospora sp. WMMD558]|uniref:hypothetical protein n=1 Tax=Micromonospora sp. WMMD558 TaxID=3403462 RepID=UPI003BF5A1B4
MHEIRTATYDMQIWLIDRWTGTPVNAAPDEHDAVAWFETSDLDSPRLGNESYLLMLTAVRRRLRRISTESDGSSCIPARLLGGRSGHRWRAPDQSRIRGTSLGMASDPG